jgi:hypothetical protein
LRFHLLAWVLVFRLLLRYDELPSCTLPIGALYAAGI